MSTTIGDRCFDFHSLRKNREGLIEVVLSPVGIITIIVVTAIMIAILYGLDWSGASSDNEKLSATKVDLSSSVDGTDVAIQARLYDSELENAKLVLHVGFSSSIELLSETCPSALATVRNSNHYALREFSTDSPGSVSGNFGYTTALEEYGSPFRVSVVAELSYKHSALFTTSGPSCKAVYSGIISVQIGP